MKKVITIVGARPQFVKAAVVSRALAKRELFQEKIVHTGQHYDKNMSDVFFEEMDIPRPHYNLEIHSASHGAMTGRMLESIEQILLQEQPDIVLVYGDTNSTLAGALAASKLGLYVAHVEAGLRSFNMAMPEEINRILTDRISNVLFCPTRTAVHNLHKEGYQHFDSQIWLVGDVMYDAVQYYRERAGQKSNIIVNQDLHHKQYILVTIHRQENTDDLSNLKEIIAALNELANQYEIIWPMHPRTRKVIENHKIALFFQPLQPVGYFDMLQLIEHAQLVMTDSGGLQKEAYFFGKFCVTMRDQTEWVELVESGVNRLTGASRQKILDAVNLRTSDVGFGANLYGDGNAGDLIVEHLLK